MAQSHPQRLHIGDVGDGPDIYLSGGKKRDEPVHREIGQSAGLHLFQELSTLGQQLAHTALLPARKNVVLLPSHSSTDARKTRAAAH